MIESDCLLSIFGKLISFDSPSFGERQIGDDVVQQLRDLGFDIWEDEAAEAIGGSCGNLHAYLEGNLDLPPLRFSERTKLTAEKTIEYFI